MDSNLKPVSNSSYQWPPRTVENPWDKEFSPKDFPTAHKIPSTLPKRWELHEDSCSCWSHETPPLWIKFRMQRLQNILPDWKPLPHYATISSTPLEVAYKFLQKVMIFLCSSIAKDSIKNASLLDDLLQRANSTVLEAQLMSHDAGVTGT